MKKILGLVCLLWGSVIVADDSYEQNDTFSTAAEANLDMTGLIASDKDYYRIPLGAGDQMIARSTVLDQLWVNQSETPVAVSQAMGSYEVASFTASSDGWYTVYFPSYGGVSYSLGLDITSGNNDFSGRRILAHPPFQNGTVPGWNTDSDTESGEPFPTTRTLSNSIWWQYRPTASGTLELNTQFSHDGNGGGHDTWLALYKGISLASLELVEYNDDV